MRRAIAVLVLSTFGVAAADDGVSAPGSAPPSAPPTSGPPAAAAQLPRPAPTYTVSIEPMLLFFTTAGVVIERSVVPHVSVAATVGAGNNSQVTFGDRVRESAHGETFEDLHTLDWMRVHAGVQANAYFDENFRGAHVGAEVSYKHFWPDDDAVEDLAVLTGSAYFGWKWLTASGWTVTFQLGGSLVGMLGDTDSMRWSLNRDGTLKTVHLYGKLAVGYSF